LSEVTEVTENIPLSPSIYDGLDPVPQPKSAATEAFEALGAAVGRAKAAIEAGRQPGMPLSILANVAREAPLGSLLFAFLIGIAIGRRTR
jgi:hypothetical protein